MSKKLATNSSLIDPGGISCKDSPFTLFFFPINASKYPPLYLKTIAQWPVFSVLWRHSLGEAPPVIVSFEDSNGTFHADSYKLLLNHQCNNWYSPTRINRRTKEIYRAVKTSWIFAFSLGLWFSQVNQMREGRDPPNLSWSLWSWERWTWHLGCTWNSAKR